MERYFFVPQMSLMYDYEDDDEDIVALRNQHQDVNEANIFYEICDRDRTMCVYIRASDIREYARNGTIEQYIQGFRDSIPEKFERFKLQDETNDVLVERILNENQLAIQRIIARQNLTDQPLLLNEIRKFFLPSQYDDDETIRNDPNLLDGVNKILRDPKGKLLYLLLSLLPEGKNGQRIFEKFKSEELMRDQTQVLKELERLEGRDHVEGQCMVIDKLTDCRALIVKIYDTCEVLIEESKNEDTRLLLQSFLNLKKLLSKVLNTPRREHMYGEMRAGCTAVRTRFFINILQNTSMNLNKKNDFTDDDYSNAKKMLIDIMNLIPDLFNEDIDKNKLIFYNVKGNLMIGGFYKKKVNDIYFKKYMKYKNKYLLLKKNEK